MKRSLNAVEFFGVLCNWSRRWDAFDGGFLFVEKVENDFIVVFPQLPECNLQERN